MKLDPILTKASRLARSGKYEAAIRTLQPEVTRYHKSFRYYYLLGASCLYAGDYNGALTYLRLANETKSNDPLAILGLAALYLRRSQTDRSGDYYLEVLELDPKNRTAKKAMGILRKNAGTDAFSAWLDSGKLPSLFPHFPAPGFSAKEIFALITVIAAVCVLILGLLMRFKFISNPFRQKIDREGISYLTQEEMNEPVLTGDYRYTLNRTQTVDAYDKALSFFSAYRDEAARVQINRILESNASEGLKNRARLMHSSMAVPDFDSVNRKDNIPYAEASKDPALYNGVHVIWQGMTANIVTTDNGTTFDLLVDFNTSNTLSGIIQVKFNRAVLIRPELPIEVLGRIIPNNSLIQLEGVRVYQSIIP
jgi:tetratricopeptide (TPR) repeat protein